MRLANGTLADIGRTLQTLRAVSGHRSTVVARMAGISATELAYIESGESKASLYTYQRVARALGSSLTDVVARAGDERAQWSGAATSTTTADVGRAICDLGARGSKVEAAVSAAVREAMRRTGDNQSAAARLLGMERKAFVRRLAKAKRVARGTKSS